MDTPSIPLKRCTKCGKEFSATLEYFPPDKRLRDGLKWHCRLCTSAYQAHWKKQNPDKVKATKAKYRSSDVGKRKENEYRSQYYEVNREREHERNRRYHETNASRIHERKHCYYEQNIDKERERGKRYRSENAERLRKRQHERYASNPEKVREIGRRSRRRNLEKDAAKTRRRRARKMKAEGFHTSDDVQLQIKSQTDKKGILRCWWCDEPIKDKYHVDHRIPLIKGGSNWPSNLCICHPTCNSKKKDRMPWEFNGRLL